MQFQTIPLSKLVPSPENVRKTNTKDGIEGLATNIKAHGLLSNLIVRATDGGKFEVVAGGRRLAALKHLAKTEKQDEDKSQIPCSVIEGDEDAHEISLSENEMRAAMHPTDQFEAFKKLADEGQGNDTIAAKFGVTARGRATAQAGRSQPEAHQGATRRRNDTGTPDGLHAHRRPQAAGEGVEGAW